MICGCGGKGTIRSHLHPQTQYSNAEVHHSGIDDRKSFSKGLAHPVEMQNLWNQQLVAETTTTATCPVNLHKLQTFHRREAFLVVFVANLHKSGVQILRYNEVTWMDSIWMSLLCQGFEVPFIFGVGVNPLNILKIICGLTKPRHTFFYDDHLVNPCWIFRINFKWNISVN